MFRNQIATYRMSDQIAKGDDFQKQAEKKLKGWVLFDSKHEDAAEL